MENYKKQNNFKEVKDITFDELLQKLDVSGHQRISYNSLTVSEIKKIFEEYKEIQSSPHLKRYIEQPDSLLNVTLA